MTTGSDFAAAKSFFTEVTTSLSAAVVASRKYASVPLPFAVNSLFKYFFASFCTFSGALPASTTSARAARARPFSS